MARLPRVIAVDGVHHVTQRGNDRRFILETDADRHVYMELLKQSLSLHDVAVMGYCLMSNHVHLLLIPDQLDTLGQSLKHAHGRFASYWNATRQSVGHVWQGRYYSCPLDDSHIWEALRYTELNPVRAGLVESAECWPWSSATAHCSDTSRPAWLECKRWADHWKPTTWKEFLKAGQEQSTIRAIRISTHTGRPLGSNDFVRNLERVTQRTLAPRKRGRPPKVAADTRQPELSLNF